MTNFSVPLQWKKPTLLAMTGAYASLNGRNSYLTENQFSSVRKHMAGSTYATVKSYGVSS